MPKPYKTSEKVRRQNRESRFRRGEAKTHYVLNSDSLRSVNLSSVEVNWLVAVIAALKERHP